MPAPTRLVTNVLVGYTNMYISPVGTANPADTVAFNSDWATGIPAWYFPGYTEKGLTVSFDRKEKRHMVEEISNPAQISTESSSFKVQFGLAESTLENMKYAFGGGTITRSGRSCSSASKRRTPRASSAGSSSPASSPWARSSPSSTAPRTIRCGTASSRPSAPSTPSRSTRRRRTHFPND